MLGKSSQMPERREGPPPMYLLYKRLFPVLLRLACDVDQVNRIAYKYFSLFRIPLCIEINLQFYFEGILPAVIRCVAFISIVIHFGS